MKKFLSLFLAVMMLLSLVPFASFSVSAATDFTYRANAKGTTASSDYQSGKYYSNLSKIKLTGDQRTDVLAVALSQLGYEEGNSASQLEGTSGGSSNYTEYCLNTTGYNGYAWCAAFCSWALYQSRVSDHNLEEDMYRNHTSSSSHYWCEIYCPYWVSALKNAGYFKNGAYHGGSYIPQSGDLVFFYNSSLSTVAHIGMVVYSDGTYVYTVEGNTSDSSGIEDNGGGVYFKSYALTNSRICGYGALPYYDNTAIPDIDYSGANPTAGLWITNAYKYLYADAACTTRATYSDGVYCDLPRFTMFEATGVTADKKALIVNYDGVNGYIAINSDRVIQVTTNGNVSNRDTTGNIAYGKTPVISGAGKGYGDYNASLTDAAVANSFSWIKDEWFGFYNGGDSGVTDGVNTVKDTETGLFYGTATFDLGGTYNLSKLGVHYYTAGLEAGIAPPSYIKAYTSTDGVNYTEISPVFNISASSETEWSEITVSDITASYVKFEIGLGSAFAMIDEIEIFGSSDSSSGDNNNNDNTNTNTPTYVPNDTVTDPRFILGIDISEHQAGGGSDTGRVNFETLKADGCEFVILRVHNGNRYDYAFEEFYKNARAAGMNIGVYMYTYATTASKAQQEAQMLIDYFEANDMYFEYPIFYDLEESSQNALSDANKVALATAWCDTLASQGYYPGIYTGLYTLVPALKNAGFMDKYDIWVPAYKSTDANAAQYTYNTKSYYADGFKMWQYSCINKYNGNFVFDGVYTSSAQTTINVNLDLNVSYLDYAALIKSRGLNNCEKTNSTDRDTTNNIVYGKTPVISGAGKGYDGQEISYKADLTDAMIADSLTWADDEWFGFCTGGDDPDPAYVNVLYDEAKGYYGTATFDLEGAYSIYKISVHYYAVTVAGIAPPAFIDAYVSNDGINYTKVPVTFNINANGETEWSEVSVSNVNARHIKFEFGLGAAFAMIDEIEVFGTPYSGILPNRDTTNNIIYNKTPEISGYGQGYDKGEVSYNADITDAYVSDSFTFANDEWFGFYGAGGADENADGLNTIYGDGVVYGTATFNLGGAYSLTKLGVHYYAVDEAGISAPSYIKAYASTDGINYTEIPVSFTIKKESNIEWSEITVSDVIATHIRFEIGLASYYAMIDELEAYGTVYTGELPDSGTDSDTDIVVTALRGDVNGDGNVKTTDYFILKRLIVGSASYDDLKDQDTVDYRCDVNADGKINATDYMLLKRAIMGAYTIQP